VGGRQLSAPRIFLNVGGSYMGLEFAQLTRRLGAAVTVVERSARLLPREGPVVSDGIRAILEAEGVRFERTASAATMCSAFGCPV
jgi:pyruvate/2-oxoglutarate dehydrogenase complex dihydrolipoamide dehydrogenase (E3) component